MLNWKLISDEPPPTDETEFLAYDSHARKMDICKAEIYLNRLRIWAVQVDYEYGPLTDDFGYDQANITHWVLVDPPAHHP